jgi:hypothetical protein
LGLEHGPGGGLGAEEVAARVEADLTGETTGWSLSPEEYDARLAKGLPAQVGFRPWACTAAVP